ncbi:hypothetical protein GNI_070470 [Gregarina niphandrodes]|uniref:Uncharacterized protein n=1 Tax=Gregarina niphandrodes TaxID=110365 RepID=A0A023B7B7_GRENI|nr:hypothetical protein GNI_070470 [Gregarina niphandrodes]EZG67208.1 hypothetical protein GNI_070470 [Gregarina niphandrodes]|eukprot:XP_011130297.1 hypothetical protein GNI_070470 [Gregarina niphandrodes]
MERQLSNEVMRDRTSFTARPSFRKQATLPDADVLRRRKLVKFIDDELIGAISACHTFYDAHGAIREIAQEAGELLRLIDNHGKVKYPREDPYRQLRDMLNRDRLIDRRFRPVARPSLAAPANDSRSPTRSPSRNLSGNLNGDSPSRTPTSRQRPLTHRPYLRNSSSLLYDPRSEEFARAFIPECLRSTGVTTRSGVTARSGVTIRSGPPAGVSAGASQDRIVPAASPSDPAATAESEQVRWDQDSSGETTQGGSQACGNQLQSAGSRPGWERRKQQIESREVLEEGDDIFSQLAKEVQRETMCMVKGLRKMHVYIGDDVKEPDTPSTSSASSALPVATPKESPFNMLRKFLFQTTPPPRSTIGLRDALTSRTYRHTDHDPSTSNNEISTYTLSHVDTLGLLTILHQQQLLIQTLVRTTVGTTELLLHYDRELDQDRRVATMIESLKQKSE